MWTKLDREARLALIVIAIAAVYRCVFIGLFPLGPDESLYWDWSRRLDLCYVAHPPMVAYAFAVMSWLLGNGYWASRLLACLLAAGSGWLLFCTGRELFNGRVGFWAAVFHAACPMFSMAGGSLLLPESILTFWMTAGLWLSARLVTRGNMRLFYALGVVLGLALLSKYPGVLILAALGLFAICSPGHRRWFLRKEPYICVLIALVVFSPVIVWNVQNDWASVRFIDQRTQESDTPPGIGRVWQSLAAQAGYHSPLLFVLLFGGVGVAAYRGFARKDDRALLLFCYSGPVMIVFLVFAAFRHTLPHWPAAGYLAAYVATPAVLLGVGPSGEGPPVRRRRIGLMAAAALVGAAESALMPVLVVYPLTTVCYDRVQRVIGLPPEVVEPMAETAGWDAEIRERIVELRRHVEAKYGQKPVVMTHYHMLAGLLAYGLRDECEVISLHARARQYDIWFSDDDVRGKPVIYVSSDNSASFRGEPMDFYQFDECAAQPPLPISRHGVTFNEVYFWVCTGYAGAADAD